VRIVIAGGGTGGHVFPGIAVAEAIESEAPDATVIFMGGSRSIEERVVTESGRAFVPVPSAALRRGRDVRNLALPVTVGVGYLRALTALARQRPDAAVGTGGFASVPPILAAWTLRVPVLLQEQNAYPGLATRFLSRVAREVHVSFDETRSYLPRARRVVVSGNPVRAGFRSVDKRAARAALGLSTDAPVLFCLGGSRGAHRINEAVIAAAGQLRKAGVELIAQTGADEFDAVRAAAERSGLRAVVRSFFDNIAEAYAASDLVVSRAGATTIAELTLVGRPAILVPYPYAAEGHQMKNARSLERSGAALVVPDAELAGDVLAAEVDRLIRDPARLGAMADASRRLARPDAAVRVARAVLALARDGGGRAEAAGGAWT